MSWAERAYEVAVRAGAPVLRAASALDEKLARGVAGRRHAVGHLERWAARCREAARPLLWFHAPSAGEALMAQATIEAVRCLRPEAQIAFTYFSPSAERIVPRISADVSGYLPWDVTREASRAVDALSPSAIAFVRTDVWPVLARVAHGRGVALALINAVLAERSSRLRPVARVLLEPAYARLDAVGAVSDRDASRFESLGVPNGRVHVTGDARFDQVLRRREAGDRDSSLRALLREEVPVLVAGSTWPRDEDVLIDAFTQVRRCMPVRLVLVPHEPALSHIDALESRLDRAGVRGERLSDAERHGRAESDVMVVDRVGVLADLYAAATIAYVGGGLGRSGLHSIIEPAAFGVPVLFGPRFGGAGEAHDLTRTGGGFVVRSAAELVERLTALLSNAASRHAAGASAAGFVEAGRGGAERNARLVLRLLNRLTESTVGP